MVFGKVELFMVFFFKAVGQIEITFIILNDIFKTYPFF